MEERFYYCDSCGNLMIAAIASGIIPHCCGSKMTLLTPNTSDGNREKHVPVITMTSSHAMKVTIGSEPHPMTPGHSIRFVCLVTDRGGIIHYLNDGAPPEVTICFNGKPKAVYAYCNIHGLWRFDIPDRCAPREPTTYF